MRRTLSCLLALGTGLAFAGAVAPTADARPADTANIAASPPQYVPLGPDRILDTRLTGQPLSGAGYPGSGPVSPGVVYTVDLTKTDLPAGIGALAVNVTAVGPTSVGNLRVGPSCSGSAPSTSIVNFQPGQDVANYLVVPLQCSSTAAPTEALTIYSAGSPTNVLLDVTGYYPTATGDPTTTPGFTGVTPYRAVDTRIGQGSPQSPIAANTSRAFQISGGTVPSGASAVAINVTSVAQPGPGNLRVYPDGSSVPDTSNVNFVPGVDKAAFVIVQLPADGKIDVYAAGSADDVVIDVFGYYPQTVTLVTQAPERVFDSRSTSELHAGTPLDVPVTVTAGAPYGIPAGSPAVLVSLTAIHAADSTGVGNLRAYASGTPAPNASNINYIGTTADVANLAILPVGTNGKITLLSTGSDVDVAADVLGYVPPPAGPGTPISAPGDTSRIQLLSTTTDGAYTVDYYENPAYPCAISGFQTFMIEYRTGSDVTSPAPLWVHMHGGGIGVWSTDANGMPVFLPDDQFTSQEPVSELESRAGTGGLSEMIANDSAGFRIMSVSYCDRDVYGGTGATDPGNPNTYTAPDGSTQPRTTNGLLATKAAIQYALASYPTTTYFLQGTSAGSAGSYAVAWGLQQQGIPPAGFVADSGVANPAADAAKKQQNLSCGTPNKPGIAGAIQQRVNPVLADPDDSPDQLVARGDLTVPVAQIWDVADPTACGDTPMVCPLQHMPPGSPSTQQMGAADCTDQALHQAIVNEGANSTSISLRVCVDPARPLNPRPGVCTRHVVTTIDAVSSIGTANYNLTLLDWVHARLGP